MAGGRAEAEPIWDKRAQTMKGPAEARRKPPEMGFTTWIQTGPTHGPLRAVSQQGKRLYG